MAVRGAMAVWLRRLGPIHLDQSNLASHAVSSKAKGLGLLLVVVPNA